MKVRRVKALLPGQVAIVDKSLLAHSRDQVRPDKTDAVLCPERGNSRTWELNKRERGDSGTRDSGTWDKLSPRDKLPSQDIKAGQVVSAKVQGVATSMHRHQALLLQDERSCS